MKMVLELGKLYAKFGATSLMRLAVASLNILRCPKMQKFVPLISRFWAEILGFFEFLDHCKILHPSEYVYEE